MIPTLQDIFARLSNLSRVCGDDPVSHSVNQFNIIFVPRMRGWSLQQEEKQAIAEICPAYAGMIPEFFLLIEFFHYLSRVCGDDPGYRNLWRDGRLFVPRMRGWSLSKYLRCTILRICPAYAGMILRRADNGDSGGDLSRVCGDDPVSEFNKMLAKKFVPRMRGWS